MSNKNIYQRTALLNSLPCRVLSKSRALTTAFFPQVLSTEDLTTNGATKDAVFTRGSILGEAGHHRGAACCWYLLRKEATFPLPV